MTITPITTHKISLGEKLEDVLDKHLRRLPERAVVAVTSKIVSLSEGRAVHVGDAKKAELVRQEADYFLPPNKSKYRITLTMKNNILIPEAGIDESNADGHYVLWPRDAQRAANALRAYLMRRFRRKRVGIIITDSKTFPLQWGTVGTSLAHSGFSALRNYIGHPDIFGRTMVMTKANIAEALAVAAVLAMGEGNEQTPLALVEKIPFVQFRKRNPTSKELRSLRIAPKNDLYAPLIRGVQWKKGGGTTGSYF